MIFFAEEPMPKTGDAEAGPTETEKTATSPAAPRPEVAESGPPSQPALFASAAGAPASTEIASEEREEVTASEPVPAVSEAPPATVEAPVVTAPPPAAKPKVKKKTAAGAAVPAAMKSGQPAPPSREVFEDRAVIKVIGVGGGGGNAVNRMIEAGVSGVEFIAANTDAQALELAKAPVKIQLGSERTGGLGVGGDPEVGRAAACDDMNRLIEVLTGADMVFITVGEGGGTGTGAAPVVACVAQEVKALSIAVATKPMTVEGRRRKSTANDGIRELREYVDTLICVPNDRVVEVYGNLKLQDAFRAADDVVRQAVQGISDLIQIPGEINLDFADVRSAMRLRGDAVMGIGQATGENRVEEATESAISSPLLEDTSIQGATSIIVNVTGGESLTLNEVQRAVEVVRDAVVPEGTGTYGSADPEPGDNILIGTAVDPTMDETGEIKVTVVATGLPDRKRANATPSDFANYTGGGMASLPGRSGPLADRASSGRVGRKIPRLDTFPKIKESEASRIGARKSESGEDRGSEAAAAPASRLVIDEPMSLPDDAGDDRWGDLETPAYLHRRR